MAFFGFGRDHRPKPTDYDSDSDDGDDADDSDVQAINSTMDPRVLAEAITAAAAALPVAAAAPKLPGFWRNQPDLWFARVEAEFTTAGVTQQATKYSCVVKILTEEVATDVKHLLTVVPADRPYDTLKAALIKACKTTEQDKVRRFNALSLGDLRPSQLLRRMQDLQPDGSDTSWYRSAFLSKLPAALQLHLTAVAGDLEAVADAADALVDTFRLQPLQAAAQVVQPGEPSEEVALHAELAAVYTKFGRKPPQQQQQTPKKERPRQTESGLCWFHERFGEKATRCRNPCNYKPAGKD
jgi:hypothetical protein